MWVYPRLHAYHKSTLFRCYSYEHVMKLFISIYYISSQNGHTVLNAPSAMCKHNLGFADASFLD